MTFNVLLHTLIIQLMLQVSGEETAAVVSEGTV